MRLRFCFNLLLLAASAFGDARGPLGIDSTTSASAIYLPDLNVELSTPTIAPKMPTISICAGPASRLRTLLEAKQCSPTSNSTSNSESFRVQAALPAFRLCSELRRDKTWSCPPRH